MSLQFDGPKDSRSGPLVVHNVRNLELNYEMWARLNGVSNHSLALYHINTASIALPITRILFPSDSCAAFTHGKFVWNKHRVVPR